MPEAKRLETLDYSILQQCMHCGMCLPTCPTYDETGLERNSPRGRISLMRAIADGQLELTPAFGEEMYYCLGCLACTTACPAGVDYADLFENARADIEDAQILDTKERRFWRWLAVKTIFMRPRLLRAIGRVMWLYQSSGLQALLRRIGAFRLLPRNLRELEPMAPRIQRSFSDGLIAREEVPAEPPRFRVGMLTGCVQDLAFSDVNRDTVDVLLANGCSVVTPRCQACCGSLHGHNGETALAEELARRAIDQFDLDEVDAIISNAGGCGSHLKHYGRLLKNDPDYAAKAAIWDSKLKDIHEWLDEIGLAPPPALPEPMTVTYHDSCHLCHGQGVSRQPRDLLKAVPNLTLKPLAESSWCCGSAGVYNITQPEQAGKLQKRKVANILQTAAPNVATANPGCHLQLQTGLRIEGSDTIVHHPVSILARAYRNR